MYTQGKIKDSIYSAVQVFVTSGAVGPTATVTIQGTADAMTGVGVMVPVVLTNGATTCTLPQQSYSLNTPDGNGKPTGMAANLSNTPQSFYAIPMERTFGINALYPPPITGPIALQTGMVISGVVGLALNTTITVNNAQSLTLSAAFTGVTGTYYVNIANPYWAKTALATITLSGATTTYDGDQVQIISNMKYIRANVTVLTGTTPSVQVWMVA
jgi:hypothetical protein